jgi:hypothetical protein
VASDFACTDTKLRQLVRLMGRHYDAELLKVCLRMTQFWLLREVLECGSARPCDLAKAMARELTSTLKPLIGVGWMELAAFWHLPSCGRCYPLPCDDGLLAPASRAI